ncbi:hypothetical protein LR48_Vigan09g084700 [Vigna angularis]|uniref:Putative plant transposon protein domain-containing protein n=1 Tax=Phaseolus angularis TaxID=3914 RepID=A0A0L9VB05_PHAAN|nr:hypothetical protein LR48_Vigan09g084700 [Vigna angularis]
MMDWMVEIGVFPPLKPLGAVAAASLVFSPFQICLLQLPLHSDIKKGTIIESRANSGRASQRRTSVPTSGRVRGRACWTSALLQTNVPFLDERALLDERPMLDERPLLDERPHSGRASSFFYVAPKRPFLSRARARTSLFLHIEWTGVQCQFALDMEEGADFDDMERTLAIFLYCVLRGLNINIEQVIANEIRTCASTVNNKASLGHPSLITHLYEVAHLVPPRHPPRVHRRGPPPAQAPPQHADPFQMRDMYMSLMESRMQALHGGHDQAQASGAGAADALTMEEEDDYEDAKEGEEEEEEEDSDDSMG